MSKVDDLEQSIKDNPRQLPYESWVMGHHHADGIYAKEMKLGAGSTAISHEHAYDHLSILAKGSAMVTVDDEETIYNAPCCITIRAGAKHAIEAITEISWFCIHNEEVALCRGQ